ncbi:MAG: hypothetical protein EWV82_00135 [Microcystis aeruginosa Ma_AC_P_19900807_S299]|jgi:hypothetical protein|nr:MAG: hypothetical protein EWV82_00135 [Microcystis aeruginosa Ma_AC_P_19900807_S299]
MSNSQPNPLELAKQGDTKSITFLINRSLKSQGITAKTIIQDSCLIVMLESQQVPEQKTLALLIYKGVLNLGIKSIQTLKVYGRQIGQENPAWKQDFNLAGAVKVVSNTENNQISNSIDKVEKDNLESSKIISPIHSNDNPQIKSAEQKETRKNVIDKILLQCQGENGSITISESRVVIKRKIGFLSLYNKEEISIYYKDILDFQYEQSHLLKLGFIYFQTGSYPNEINLMIASSHENAVTFLHKKVKDFDQIKEILTQKINPQKYDNVFEGRSGTLVITDTGIIIKRNGGLFSGYPSGQKNIPYSSITAIQFKRADITVGFIQFTLKGGIEAKAGVFEAVTDENTITFGTEERSQEFEKAKQIIEKKMIESKSPQSAVNTNNDLEQLEKLASLKDKGIISQEEFEAKKKQILGL